MAAPSTPANMLVQTANGTVLVTWDQVAGATSYVIYKSTDNVTYASLATVSTVYQYLDSAVTSGTRYWYQVTASNGTESNPTVPQDIVPAGDGKISLASLRLAAQQRADRVNSEFVTKQEWNSYINQSAFELYDLIVNTYEDWYFATPYSFQTDGSASYDLPPLMYRLMGVDLGIAENNNAWVTVPKYDFVERNRYVYPNVTSTYYGMFNLRYRAMGNKLNFIPTPSSGQYIRVWYVPRMVEMVADTDVLDMVSGWQEYIVVDATIKALQKEESDVSALMVQKQALIKRIEESAINRDLGQPDTISNTRSWGSRNGQYGGPGYDGGFGGY